MKKSTLNRILSLVLAMTMSLTLCIPAFAMPISASMPTYEGTMKNIQGQMKEQDAMYLYPILERIIRAEYEAGTSGTLLEKNSMTMAGTTGLKSAVYETWKLKSAYFDGTEDGDEFYFGRVGKADATGETVSVGETRQESISILGTIGVQKRDIQAVLGFDYSKSVAVSVTKTSRPLNMNEIVESYVHFIYNRYSIIQIHTIRLDGKTFTYDVPATILRPQPFAQVRFEYHY